MKVTFRKVDTFDLWVSLEHPHTLLECRLGDLEGGGGEGTDQCHPQTTI